MDSDRFDKFSSVDEVYLPPWGEGDTKATQICTAVTKLVYKWYNDGDVFDNTHTMEGWCNDLSCYANWLWKNVPESKPILAGIETCYRDDDYEQLLYDLCEAINTEEFLGNCANSPRIGTIYDCKGPFKFVEAGDDDDYYDDYCDDDEDEDEDEDGW